METTSANLNNPNNKPEIIIRDNGKGTCMLLDVAITETNVILKYK